MANSESKTLNLCNRRSDGPGCKFKFLGCLNVYFFKNGSIWTMKGPSRALFTKAFLKFATWDPFGAPLRPRRFLLALVELNNYQQRIPNV